MINNTKFGRLTLTGKSELRKCSEHNRTFVEAKCVCGKIGWYRLNSLQTKNTKSCGCLIKEQRTKHNKCHTRIYRIWHNIKSRCLNKNNPDYPKYGGKGIGMVPRWEKFENFFEDMGNPPSIKHSIDRINNNKGYSKKNCRWATPKQQMDNRKCTIFYRGETSTDASLRLGGKEGFVYRRIKVQGWSKNKAFTTPITRKNTTRYRGKTPTEQSLLLNGHKSLVSERLSAGWSLEKAFTTPVIKNRRNKKYANK